MLLQKMPVKKIATQNYTLLATIETSQTPNRHIDKINYNFLIFISWLLSFNIFMLLYKLDRYVIIIVIWTKVQLNIDSKHV